MNFPEWVEPEYRLTRGGYNECMRCSAIVGETHNHTFNHKKQYDLMKAVWVKVFATGRMEPHARGDYSISKLSSYGGETIAWLVSKEGSHESIRFQTEEEVEKFFVELDRSTGAVSTPTDSD